MQEYIDLNHTEAVPVAHLEKPRDKVLYFPMHEVVKESSTTAKIRTVFDTLAKTSTGTSLKDQLLVGTTVHSFLVDTLL